jgi:hypothetical protein
MIMPRGSSPSARLCQYVPPPSIVTAARPVMLAAVIAGPNWLASWRASEPTPCNPTTTGRPVVAAAGVSVTIVMLRCR